TRFSRDWSSDVCSSDLRIRSLLRRGIPVGVAPDGIDNPFWEIMVITTQQSDPNENITREEAVIAYTRTNAYAEFMEKDKGTLSRSEERRVGKECRASRA